MKAIMRKVDDRFIEHICAWFVESAKEYEERLTEFQAQESMDAADQEILGILRSEWLDALAKAKVALQAVNVPYSLTGPFLEEIKKADESGRELNATVRELLSAPDYRWHS